MSVQLFASVADVQRTQVFDGVPEVHRPAVKVMAVPVRRILAAVITGSAVLEGTASTGPTASLNPSTEPPV
jgi:hypothetical protein